MSDLSDLEVKRAKFALRVGEISEEMSKLFPGKARDELKFEQMKLGRALTVVNKDLADERRRSFLDGQFANKKSKKFQEMILAGLIVSNLEVEEYTTQECVDKAKAKLEEVLACM